MSEKKTMYDMSAYSSRTISVYQLVGAYIVDIYYNYLHAEATKLKRNGKVPSITEGYRHATFAFVSAIGCITSNTYKSEHYTKLLQGINEYFINWTSFSSLTMSECIDKIVREFVPDDYYLTLDKDQKRTILRELLTSTIRTFNETVITGYLKDIIDNHDDVANVEALKGEIIQIFIAERENMFHRFLKQRGNRGGDNDKIDKQFADKMRNEIIRLIKECETLQKTKDQHVAQYEIRTDQLEKVLKKYRTLEHAHKALTAEYSVTKNLVAELEAQVLNLENNNHRLNEQLYSQQHTQQHHTQHTQQQHTQQHHTEQPTQHKQHTQQPPTQHTQQPPHKQHTQQPPHKQHTQQKHIQQKHNTVNEPTVNVEDTDNDTDNTDDEDVYSTSGSDSNEVDEHFKPLINTRVKAEPKPNTVNPMKHDLGEASNLLDELY